MRLQMSLLSVLGLLIANIASASTFDAVADFGSSNPSGAWSYGTGVIGTSFTPLTVFTSSNCFGASGFSCWQTTTPIDGVPVVGHNGSGATVDFSTVVFPTGALLVHPGPSTDTIVTWTAPAAGTYNISGFFELLDVAPTGVVTAIYDNSTQAFTATLTNPPAAFPSTVGGRQSFSLVETVTSGTTISFGVNNDGNFFDDSTGFDAAISSVNSSAAPEPTSLVLVLAAGLTGLGAMRLRRLI